MESESESEEVEGETSAVDEQILEVDPPARHTAPSQGGGNKLRFAVALSFPGEKRGFVSDVASYLAGKLSTSRVLYDRFHREEFARPDLGFHLPELYAKHSELVVVFVCDDYEQKRWCGAEWRKIHDLIFNGHDARVMLVRLDSRRATLRGLSESAGFYEVNTRTDSPESVARAILRRGEQSRGEQSKGARKGPPPRDGVVRPPGGASVSRQAASRSGHNSTTNTAKQVEGAAPRSVSIPSATNTGARSPSPNPDAVESLAEDKPPAREGRSRTAASSAAPEAERAECPGTAKKHTPSDWDAVREMASILGRAPRTVMSELDKSLGGAGRLNAERGAETARRVAERIDALGSGFDAAKTLIRAVDEVLAELRDKHPHDLEQGRRVLCCLLNEWMPRRYDGGDHLAREVGPPEGLSDAYPDLDVDTFAKLIAAYLVSSASGRGAKIRRRCGATSVEVPYASKAQMLTVDKLVQSIVQDLIRPDPGQFEDTPSGRLEHARGRLAEFHERTPRGIPIEKTPPWDITLSEREWQELLPEGGRRALKLALPALRQVALHGSRRPGEPPLVRKLLRIYTVHDDTDEEMTLPAHIPVREDPK